MKTARFTPASRAKGPKASGSKAAQHAPKAAFSTLARKPTRNWRLNLKRDNGAA